MAFKLFPKESVLFPQEKKQRKLIIILTGLMLTTLVVLYFGFFRASTTPGVPSVEPGSIEPGLSFQPSKKPAEVIKKIEFDIGFLKEPTFRALKVYGEWPIKIEERGRENPFLPY